MLALHEWAARERLTDKPWLIVGKGPSFGHHDEYDLSRFHVFGLNHVVRELEVDVAHAIDIDVVAQCEAAVRANCRWLMLPRHPHVQFDPTSKRLEDFFDEIPVLRQLDEEGRLVWYNLANYRQVGDAPVIKARFFSAEAAFNILGVAGVKTVRTLGIDGGRAYSPAFEDLEGATMLANGRESFDVQFAEIEKIVRANRMDYAPLVKPVEESEPIRVFVGADESQLVAAAVLEYSIRKHASRPVEFTTMIDLEVPVPKDKANRARTGFSFYRFLIPKLCGFEGRALYLDCDMQVFADMAELWNIPFGDQKVLCTYQGEPPEQWKDNPAFSPGRQLSVMMIDCSRLDWDIDEIIRGLDDGAYTYKQLMGDLAIVEPTEIDERIPPEWNHLEHYEPGVTKLLHYTVVPTQPWKNDRNPLREIWLNAFREAAREGAIGRELVERGIDQGHVKRDLLGEFDTAIRGPAAESEVDGRS